MRSSSLLVLLLALVGVSTDSTPDTDAAYCENECTKKFPLEAVKAACVAGCGHRAAITEDGTRGFAVCHSGCAADHNTTDSEERRACDFACSLPLISLLMMKLDYGTGDETPRVQVIRKSGGGNINPFLIDFPSSFGDDAIGAKASLAADDLQAAGDTMQEEVQKLFSEQTKDPDFEKMQTRLNALVKSMFDRANLASRPVAERPSGHEGLTLLRSPLVGNSDGEGNRILFVSPMQDDDEEEEEEDERRLFDRVRSSRQHTLDLFQFTSCLLLALSLACLVALFYIRQKRASRYHALRAQMGAGTGPASTAAPISLLEAGEMIKKVPLDEAYSAPEGPAPPAYDEVSVHSKKGEAQEL